MRGPVSKNKVKSNWKKLTLDIAWFLVSICTYMCVHLHTYGQPHRYMQTILQWVSSAPRTKAIIRDQGWHHLASIFPKVPFLRHYSSTSLTTEALPLQCLCAWDFYFLDFHLQWLCLLQTQWTHVYFGQWDSLKEICPLSGGSGFPGHTFLSDTILGHCLSWLRLVGVDSFFCAFSCWSSNVLPVRA